MHAKAICRCVADPGLEAPWSRWLFCALLELLLERGELGKRRIGIRLFVASVGAMRLREILLTLRAPDPIIAIAARPAASPRSVVALATLALTLHPLLPLMPVKTLLAIGTIASVMAGASGIGRGLGCIWCSDCRGFCCRACRSGTGFGGRSCLWLRAMRTARPMRTAFGSPRRPPDFDEGRLLDRLIFGRISLRVVRRLRDGLG
ncbi:MAG: hypothetical protein WB522_00170, partial [Pseudolabrys sp.]